MSTEETTATVATEEPKYGLAAAQKILDARRPAEGDEDDEDDEEEGAEKPKPEGREPPKPKKSVGAKIKSLRTARNAARAKAEELERELTKLRSAPPAPVVDLDLAKTSPLAALEKLGLSRAEVLDLVQKESLELGALPPAVAKVVGSLQEKLEAMEKRNAELEREREEREATRAHEEGMRALSAEARDLKSYPELEGYDWETEVVPAVEQAIQFLVSKGETKLPPARVIGLVNSAFKAHHERLAKRGKVPPGGTPLPAPPAKKPAPQLPPVTAGKKGKIKEPSLDEIKRRVARARQSAS